MARYTQQQLDEMYDEYAVESGIRRAGIPGTSSERPDTARRYDANYRSFMAAAARDDASPLFARDGKPVTFRDFAGGWEKRKQNENATAAAVNLPSTTKLQTEPTETINRGAPTAQPLRSVPVKGLNPAQQTGIDTFAAGADARLDPSKNGGTAVNGSGVQDMRDTNARAKWMRDNPDAQAAAIAANGGVQKYSASRMKPGESFARDPKTGQVSIAGGNAAPLPSQGKSGTMSWTDARGNTWNEDETGKRTVTTAGVPGSAGNEKPNTAPASTYVAAMEPFGGTAFKPQGTPASTPAKPAAPASLPNAGTSPLARPAAAAAQARTAATAATVAANDRPTAARPGPIAPVAAAAPAAAPKPAPTPLPKRTGGEPVSRMARVKARIGRATRRIGNLIPFEAGSTASTIARNW
jgi:hypothetical protein